VRLWSVHPRYLDRQGLTACWREGLLAQAVLLERTRGYRHHPQLARFRAQPDPAASIGAYLAAVAQEATERGYRFDTTKIERPPTGGTTSGAAARISVADGQIAFEWGHLTAKLRERSPGRVAELADVATPDAHPLFVVVPGGREPWEAGAPIPATGESRSPVES
jgi:hypothetical protein